MVMETISEERILEVYRQRITEIYVQRKDDKSKTTITRWLKRDQWKDRSHDLYETICKKYDLEAKSKFPPALDSNQAKTYAVYFNRIYDLYWFNKRRPKIRKLPELMSDNKNNLHKLYLNTIDICGGRVLPEYRPVEGNNRNRKKKLVRAKSPVSKRSPKAGNALRSPKAGKSLGSPRSPRSAVEGRAQKEDSDVKDSTEKKNSRVKIDRTSSMKKKKKKGKPKRRSSEQLERIVFEKGEKVLVRVRGKNHKAKVVRVNEDGSYNVEYSNPRLNRSRKKGGKTTSILRNLSFTKLIKTDEQDADDEKTRVGRTKSGDLLIHDKRSQHRQRDISPYVGKLAKRSPVTKELRKQDSPRFTLGDTSIKTFKTLKEERYPRGIINQEMAVESDSEKEQRAVDLPNSEPKKPKLQLHSDNIVNDLGNKSLEGTLEAKEKHNNTKINDVLLIQAPTIKVDCFINQLTKADANDPMFELTASVKVHLKDVLEIIWNRGMLLEKHGDAFCEKPLLGELSNLDKDIPILSRVNTKTPVVLEKHWKAFWLIDTLCGSKEQINCGDYTICVGLVDASMAEETPTIGVIMQPSTGTIVWGSMSGAFGFSLEKGSIEEFRLPVWEWKSRGHVALCGDRSSKWSQEVVDLFGNTNIHNVSPGVAFLKLITGVVAVAYFESVNFLEFCAGDAIIRAAGGKVTVAGTKSAPIYAGMMTTVGLIAGNIAITEQESDSDENGPDVLVLGAGKNIEREYDDLPSPTDDTPQINLIQSMQSSASPESPYDSPPPAISANSSQNGDKEITICFSPAGHNGSEGSLSPEDGLDLQELEENSDLSVGDQRKEPDVIYMGASVDTSPNEVGGQSQDHQKYTQTLTTLDDSESPKIGNNNLLETITNLNANNSVKKTDEMQNNGPVSFDNAATTGEPDRIERHENNLLDDSAKQEGNTVMDNKAAEPSNAKDLPIPQDSREWAKDFLDQISRSGGQAVFFGNNDSQSNPTFNQDNILGNINIPVTTTTRESVAIPYTPRTDEEIRASWKKGSKLRIFSSSLNEWFNGEVTDIVIDNEGEWLDIAYKKHDDQQWRKQAQRLSAELKPKDEDLGQVLAGDLKKEYNVEVRFTSKPCGFDLVDDKQKRLVKVGKALQSETAKYLLEEGWIVVAVNGMWVTGSTRQEIQQLILQAPLPLRLQFKGFMTLNQVMLKQKHPAFSVSGKSKSTRRGSRKKVPAESLQDLRAKMTLDSKCKIYSRSYKRWFEGEITNILEDQEGTWLEVTWQMKDKSNQLSNMKKQVKRDSPDILPMDDQNDIDDEVLEVIQWCRNQGAPLEAYLDVIEKHQINFTDLAALNEFTLRQLHVKENDIGVILQTIDKYIRSRWSKDCFVDVWSSRNTQWFVGHVVEIFTDKVGEWLKIKYNNDTCEKEVQRYSSTVRKMQANKKHKAMDWESKAVAWWASKQVPPMSKWTDLLREKNICGRDLLSMSELSLELIGIVEEDIENCLKRIEDLLKDPRMLKKIKKILPIRLDRVEEKKEEEKSKARLARRWKREHQKMGKYGYAWETLVEWTKSRPGPVFDFSIWGEEEVFIWLSNLGVDYESYAKLFKSANIGGDELAEFSRADLEELGIPTLHRLNITLELERLRIGIPHLLLPWTPEEVIDWLKTNDLPFNFDLLRSQKISGDLFSILTKAALIDDLKFNEATAQKVVDLRRNQMIDRCFFGSIIGKAYVDRRLYELIRKGIVNYELLMKDYQVLTKVEHSLLDSISPDFIKEFKDLCMQHLTQ